MLHKLNPYQFLGVSEIAGDEEIRAAYLAMLHDNPPDCNQQKFQQIQQAYELIKDSDSRMHYRLFHVVTITPELIAQSVTPIQQEKRVPLAIFQSVLKSILAKIPPP